MVQEARTVIDFGLVVLIWMVQLIVYPSFKHIALDQFTLWHSQYSAMISVLVVPLMLLQVGIIGYQLVHTRLWSIWVAALLVILIWISTYAQAVPVHNILQQATTLEAEQLQKQVSQLVSFNWNRTILWTCVFGLGLIRG